jgi:cytochrome c2
MSRTKKILLFFAGCCLLIYGFIIGNYRVFPYSVLLASKHYVEAATGTFEDTSDPITTAKVQKYNTELERLLIKKIKIPELSSSGGGLSATGNILYIVTNKGNVRTFDLASHTVIKNNIPDVPMNFKGLILSGYTSKNDFHITLFRVNGAYSEPVNSNTQVLFTTYDAYDSQKGCITFNIGRIDLTVNNGSVKQKGNWKTIFTASPCIDPASKELNKRYKGQLSGGAITSFDQHHLLVSVGDYDFNGILGPTAWAMDRSNPYGKFILVNKNTGKWSIYAIGSRNATGIYIDKDSVIWSVENGPRGGDELNIIQKGKNYGWPEVSYGIWYNPHLKLPGGYKSGTYPKYQKPVFSWLPSVAPRGLIKIEGTKFNYWKGDLIMGTMRDESLHRLRLDGKNHVEYDERIELGHRVRDLITLPDGRIALITDDGYLMIIGDGGAIWHKTDATIKRRIASLNKFDHFTGKTSTLPVSDTMQKTALSIFKQHCSSCHNLSTDNHIGPNLHNLFSRKVGELDDFSYSSSMQKDTSKWNATLLKTFLKNPKEVFPDTKMPKVNLSSSEIDSLIQLFKDQASVKLTQK